MSRDSLGTLGKHLDRARVASSGGSRVARLFVPKSNTSPTIRLGTDRRRTLARRQLARLIEPRRMAS